VAVEVPVTVSFEEIVVELELEDVEYRYTPTTKDTTMIGITAIATSFLPFDNPGLRSKRGRVHGAISFLGIHTLFSSRERKA
jgi:hypothetical protein